MTPKAILVALFLLTLAAYWPVRQAAFVYEDEVYVGPAQRALTAEEVFAPRGLTALSFRLNGWAAARDPRPYHATNLFLHLLVGLSVYALACRVLTQPWACLVSGLMLLHPLQTQAVAYVAGRAELIAALGTVWVVWALAAPVVTAAHLGVALVAAVVAVGGKELGVMALPLAALYAVWFRSWRWSWRAAAWLAGAVGLVGLLIAVVVIARIWGNEYLTHAERGPLVYASIQSSALWTYLRLALVPLGQTVDHDPERIGRGLHLIGLAAGLLVAGWAVWRRRRDPVLTFGLLWVVVSLGPRFLVRQPEYLAEHQVYTAFVGLWIAGAAGLQSVQRVAWARARKDDLCDFSGSSASA